MDYYIITLPAGQKIKAKSKLFMRDIVRFFCGDVLPGQYMFPESYRFYSSIQGYIYCKKVFCDFDKINDREFIMV